MPITHLVRHILKMEECLNHYHLVTHCILIPLTLLNLCIDLLLFIFHNLSLQPR